MQLADRHTGNVALIRVLRLSGGGLSMKWVTFEYYDIVIYRLLDLSFANWHINDTPLVLSRGGGRGQRPQCLSMENMQLGPSRSTGTYSNSLNMSCFKWSLHLFYIRVCLEEKLHIKDAYPFEDAICECQMGSRSLKTVFRVVSCLHLLAIRGGKG